MLNLLKGSSLSKLSSEILKISLFARGLLLRSQATHIGANDSDSPATNRITARKHEQIMNFLISLDFQVKGLLSHWQIKLSEKPEMHGKSTEMMKGLDIKFPILIGD